MIEYTEDAAQVLEGYLSEVRIYAGAAPNVEADEVVSDIRAHLDTELAGCDQPVNATDVKAVLERLGSPQQWVSRDELPWWRRVALDLYTGPEDWRLAYLSIALFILGCTWPKSFGIIGSFLVSRAAVATAGPTDLGAKKWLVYPSLILVYVIVVPLVLVWPAFPAVGGVGQLLELKDMDNLLHLGSVMVAVAAALGAVGLWWWILRVVACRFPGSLRAAVRPFADKQGLRWLRRMPLVALFLAVAFGVAAVIVLRQA